MIVARTSEALHDALAVDRGETLALVPTMGSLHRGHLSLVRKALENADRVVVSIFVNPTQFGPGEDFGHYPRTLDRDVALLNNEGCHAVFAPDIEVLYPFGPDQSVRVIVPELTGVLCGAARPGHFDGVATVVAKLLLSVGPDVAVFGRKDYQQLLVIRRLAKDLGFPVDILAGDIVREPDGLAMSSRNAYLQGPDRALATTVYRALAAVRDRAEANATLDDAINAGKAMLTVDGIELEYLEIRRAGDLGLPTDADDDLIALAAAQVGPARLIDNVRIRRATRQRH